MSRRYSCVRQHDAADCGAACLCTVLRHHGVRVSVARMREYARTDQGGTTVLGLVEAAVCLGFEARGVKCGAEVLTGIPVPCIAHVVRGTGSHYVVVHKVSAKHVLIADPALGVKKTTMAEFVEGWTGVLVLVAPLPHIRMSRRTLAHRAPLLRWLLPHKHLLASAVCAAFLFTMLGMAGSVFLQVIVDRVLVFRDARMLWRLTFLVFGLSLLRAALGFARGILLACVGRRMDSTLMLDYFRHVLRLPLRFFETRTTGEILARFSDIVKVRDVMGGSAVVVLVDSATMLAGFCFLLHYNGALALASMLLCPLPLLAASCANSSQRQRQRLAMEEAAAVQSCLVDSLRGVATVKVLCVEEAVFQKARIRIKRLLDFVFRAGTVAISASAAGDACSSLVALTVLAWAGFMVLDGRMSAGGMVAFYSILSLMLQPVQRLISTNQVMQDAVLAAERLDDTMDLEEESTDCVQRRELTGAIELKHVSFGYAIGQTVLQDVTFRLPPRSVTAIVGPSGCGKSTLAKLILRLYEPQCGAIEIDGNEISGLCLSELRRRIRYVGPETCLFSGSLRDNLLYGDAGAGEAAMRQVLCAAGLDWLTVCPHYLDIPVGEQGTGFSAGQRQQLSIARALLSQPAVLILDEATSNLDASAHAAVVRHLHAARDRMSAIVIGHEVPPDLEPDQVLALQNGKVLETLPAPTCRNQGPKWTAAD